MNNKILDTGRMVRIYLEANDIKFDTLLDNCDVSAKTLYRFFNDESRLSYEVACGINKLLPELTLDFLMSYDAKYQLQRKQFEQDNKVENLNKIISTFQLKKLYPELASDKEKLFDKGKSVFGIDGMRSNLIEISWDKAVLYSKANESKEWEGYLWLKAAYSDCVEKGNLLNFNRTAFEREYDKIKEICGTTNEDLTLFNMRSFAEKCGINFYNRKSLPNSRIKAATIRDDEGRIFILVSDLFRCIENLWIAFVHECTHILNEDYNKVELQEEKLRAKNENYISEETARYFVGDFYDQIDECNIETVYRIAQEKEIPLGISAEIVRYKTGEYKDRMVNSTVHYY